MKSKKGPFKKTSIKDDAAHTPYSPDLAPCDFYLFPELKKMRAGKNYKTRAALISAGHGSQREYKSSHEDGKSA
jgi:hypothetical protein